MSLLNNFLFIALPYVAIVVFLVGSIHRYRATGFKYTSLSSQFLEGRGVFFFAMLFHVSILMLFLGHLFIFLFPTAALAWNSNPARLIAHEVVAFTFGLSVLIGFITGLSLEKLRQKPALARV